MPHPLRNADVSRLKCRQHAAKLNPPERLCDTQWKSKRANFIPRYGNLATQQEPSHRESPSKPGWRNWQTQRTQNPPRATSWGFDPPSRHQQNKGFRSKLASQKREANFRWWLFWWLLVFTKVAEWLFVSAMVCNESQRVTFPGFPKCSRGRIGVKAAHTRAASRSWSLDTDS
jgi:hypothetical protein